LSFVDDLIELSEEIEQLRKLRYVVITSDYNINNWNIIVNGKLIKVKNNPVTYSHISEIAKVLKEKQNEYSRIYIIGSDELGTVQSLLKNKLKEEYSVKKVTDMQIEFR